LILTYVASRIVSSDGGRGVVHGTGVRSNSAFQISVGVPGGSDVAEGGGVDDFGLGVTLEVMACWVEGVHADITRKTITITGKIFRFLINGIL
jgi:hypothetical protein